MLTGGGVTIPFQASRQAPRFLFSPSLLLAAAIAGPNEHPSRPWARKCHRSDTKLSSWRRPTITRGAWQGRGLERESAMVQTLFHPAVSRLAVCLAVSQLLRLFMLVGD